MSKITKLAWRNIWRNRRRSLITMAAIVFALLVTIVTRSMQYGTYDATESHAVQLYTGEMQVLRSGFHSKQTLTYSFAGDAHNWQAILKSHPGLLAYSRRITGFGLLGSNTTSAGATIVGVEIEREPEVSRFTTRLDEGQPLRPEDSHLVLLGNSLAKNLKASVGDTIVVLTQGYRNEMGADSYVVKGIFQSGNPDLDRLTMVMSLDDAQELFSMQGRITQVVFRTRDFRQAKKYALTLSRGLNDEFEVLPWQELLPELLQIIAWDNVSGGILLLFLLLVVGFEIMNTTMMSIMERTREFGILQSIGLKPRQIKGLIVLETVLKISTALCVGLAIALVLIAIFKNHPIDLGGDYKKVAEAFGFEAKIYLSDRIRVFAEPLVSISIISSLALLYPLRMVSRLSPVEALRRT